MGDGLWLSRTERPACAAPNTRVERGMAGAAATLGRKGLPDKTAAPRAARPGKLPGSGDSHSGPTAHTAALSASGDPLEGRAHVSEAPTTPTPADLRVAIARDGGGSSTTSPLLLKSIRRTSGACWPAASL